eukprot:386094-Prymnesium_polylepis.1
MKGGKFPQDLGSSGARKCSCWRRTAAAAAAAAGAHIECKEERRQQDVVVVVSVRAQQSEDVP